MMQSLVWLFAASGLLLPSGVPGVWLPMPDAPVVAPHADAGTAGPVLPAYVASVALAPVALDSAQHRQRPRPIEYSDAYFVRLKIHYIASFATIPLFVAEYFVGRSLYNNPGTASRSLRSWHNNLAVALGGLFTLNTVTGLWNLWESRRDPAGRARRYIHGFSMLAADAGFVATARMTPDRDFRRTGGTTGQSSANLHRALAISSMSVSLASYVMMLFWK
jgi:hypothetical protein